MACKNKKNQLKQSRSTRRSKGGLSWTRTNYWPNALPYASIFSRKKMLPVFGEFPSLYTAPRWWQAQISVSPWKTSLPSKDIWCNVNCDGKSKQPKTAASVTTEVRHLIAQEAPCSFMELLGGTVWLLTELLRNKGAHGGWRIKGIWGDLAQLGVSARHESALSRVRVSGTFPVSRPS